MVVSAIPSRDVQVNKNDQSNYPLFTLSGGFVKTNVQTCSC